VTGPPFPPGARPGGSPHAHDPEELGALALGLLDADRTRAVEEHLARCPTCRRDLDDLMSVTDLLGEVPPEAFLDGPPDNDLVLQRTLRQMRSETGAPARERRRDRRRGFLPQLVGVAAGVAVLVGGGVAVGRVTAPEPVVVAAPAGPVAGAVTLRGDGEPGVAMAAVVSPASGWVRVSATVRGIPPGERCRVVVLARDGRREVASSWLTSARGQTEGTQVDGAAIVPLDQVAGVAVENEAGREFVVLQA
jgi:anti-sigma factor RsiW